MNEVHQLPDINQVELDASAWLARLHADDATAEDRVRFEAWRNAHPFHGRVFDSLATTWRTFDAAGPLVRAVSLGHSLDEATRARVPARRQLFAFAAAAAAAAVFCVILVRTSGNSFQTAIGEHATVSLPDGSVLELNSNSRARVEFSDHDRVLRLERGEAYFKVARDASRPFWVEARGSWVRALGTAFNVYLHSTGVRVTVMEGAVKVGGSREVIEPSMPGATIVRSTVPMLSAGQEADLNGNEIAVRLAARAEISRTEAWRVGTVFFEKQPLGDVVEELNRYSTIRLVVNDDGLRKLLVGGTFQANPQGTEEFLAMLRDGLHLQVRQERGRVYIGRVKVD